MSELVPVENRPIGLPPEQFATAFPFHFALDEQFQVRQVGRTLHRICPDVSRGQLFDGLFRIIRPEGDFTLAWAVANRPGFFLLEHRASQLRLRGEFIQLPEEKALVFLGSPWFTDAAEITAHGLAYDDFAVHDPVVDLLLVFQASKLALADAKKLAEKLTTQRAELRLVNERLRQQELETSKLALIAARTTNAVVLTDAHGYIIWVNEGFTRLTEFTPAEAIGKTPGSLLQGPATDPTTVRHMREQLRLGKSFSVEIVNYTKSGRAYWLAIEMQPIRDEFGVITNYMAIESDITERKESDRQLRETNALQRAMIEGAGYAIIATDKQGLIQIFNPAAERMLGYAAREIVGRSTPEQFHVPAELVGRARELSVELARVVSPGMETFIAKAALGLPDQREWNYVRKDGSCFPVLLAITALFDDSGRITGYLGVGSDMSDRKQAEEKMRTALSELERLNRVMMNREARVLDLKNEVNQLLTNAGLQPIYRSALEPENQNPTKE